jgi:hypothetical protein
VRFFRIRLSSAEYGFAASKKGLSKTAFATIPFFRSLPAKRQKRLLDGEDMYIDGRMNALYKIE